jgi:hypothetical protein
VRDPEKRKASQARYNRSEKGKTRHERYVANPLVAMMYRFYHRRDRRRELDARDEIKLKELFG